MKRVLIVEDDSSTKRLVTILLTQAGWDVVTVSNGQEALEVLGYRANFQLLITDIQMPKLDGIHLIERIRASHPELPILTMSVFDQWGKQALQRGSNTFLLKPFSRQQLLNTIQRVVDRETNKSGFAAVSIYSQSAS